MRYLEYTLVKNTNDIVIDAPCDKIQLIRNENHTKPTVIILIKKNIPVKTIKEITTRNTLQREQILPFKRIIGTRD